MGNHYTKLKEFEQGGFLIVVDKTWEDIALRDSFDETCYDLADMERRVNNYELDWFMLRVRVMFEGHVFASQYLGGCLYEDAEDVFTDGTAEDLIAEALTEAQAEVRHLRNKLDQLLVDNEIFSPYNTHNS